MSINAEQVARAGLASAAGTLDSCLEVIRHCLDQLTVEQVWWRPASDMNAIGNLLLHLEGNVRQWIVAGLGDAPDQRDRPAEFAAREPRPATELIGHLQHTADEAKRVLAGLSGELLLARRCVQGFDLTGWEALFDCVTHFKGHTQEIVCLTRQQLGARYRFHWQPSTPQEGA